MNGVTYDAGALIAAERGSAPVWLVHKGLLERGLRPTLSTLVLGQVWRGGPQAMLSRFLRGCRIEAFTETQAKAAGSALASSGAADLIDAAVVVTALARQDLVLTSNPSDLHQIASAIGAKLVVHVV